MTMKSDTGNDEFTQTILHNMVVLSTSEVEKGPRNGFQDTVTLEVVPEEAQTLSLALQMGTLHLVRLPTRSDDP
jgi:Flp pilus assembly protein CpaB